VLAAGRGSRFQGRQVATKALAVLDGRPLVAWALAAPIEAGCHPVMLVVGHRGGRVADAAPAGVIVVRSRRWRRGISASLTAALDAVEPFVQVTALCVGLADQPRIGPEAYRRLAAAHAAGATFAVATYDGKRRNPVLLARELWPQARALTGDVGARQLMDRFPVTEVDCTSTGSPVDVDTLGDLAALGDG
jgi:molybdenum cofactor cytidylyltransferase